MNVPKNVGQNITMNVAETAAMNAVKVVPTNASVNVVKNVAMNAAGNAVLNIPMNVIKNVTDANVAKIANDAANAAVANVAAKNAAAINVMMTNVMKETAQVTQATVMNMPKVNNKVIANVATKASINATMNNLPKNVSVPPAIMNVIQKNAATNAAVNAAAVVNVSKNMKANMNVVINNATAVLESVDTLPAASVNASLNAVKNMTKVNDAMLKINDKLLNNKAVSAMNVKNVNTQITNAIANLKLSNANAGVNKVVLNAVVNKAVSNAGVNKAVLNAGVNKGVLNAGVLNAVVNKSVINNAVNAMKNVKNNIKQMFTTQGDLVNIKQNNMGKFRMQNNSKVYVTETIKNKNRVAPLVGNRKLTNGKHYTTQGNLKNVYENGNSRRYVVQESNYPKNLLNKKGRIGTMKETVYHPFGTSKFINGANFMF